MSKSQNTKNEQQKDLCITSVSIDMSTEEAPYNRLYAKPIEKQGDVLLCEFESANYDIEQKSLKEENTKLKTENKWYSEQLHEASEKCERLQKQLDIAIECLKTAINLACPYFPVKTAKADSFHQLKNIQKKCGIALQKIEELNK